MRITQHNRRDSNIHLRKATPFPTITDTAYPTTTSSISTRAFPLDC